MNERERYAAGDRIAEKYVLIRPLDSGGMGLVWAAHNVDLDVHVAVKLLRGELASTNAADRMLSEARMLARLQHPAIVRVHDCGRTPLGDPFIVMELLDGESLADFIDGHGRISSIDAVSMLLPIVDAIRVAHAAGIIHRDLKPENIFLAGVGGRIQPKVLDFGIALADFVGTRRTTHGAVLGSPAYMAPEQARGDEVSVATDVFALSIVLYELITGVLPFERENYHATLRAIIEETPPSITELGAGDELLASIVERGLAKDPKHRYPAAGRYGAALAEWLINHGVIEDACNVSLRSTWLSTSDPPSSLSPVTLPRPSLVSLAQRETLESPAAGVTPHIRIDVLPAEAKHSTQGVAVTSERPPRRQPRLWIAAGAAGIGILGALAFAFWPAADEPPGIAVSASQNAPTIPESETPKPIEAKKVDVTPRQDVSDAGPASSKGATEEAAPEIPAPKRVREAPRSPAAKPGRPFRPRGI